MLWIKKFVWYIIELNSCSYGCYWYSELLQEINKSVSLGGYLEFPHSNCCQLLEYFQEGTFKSLKHPEEFVNKIDSLIFIHEDKYLLIYYKHLIMSKVKVFEENAWNAFVLEQREFDFVKSCIEFVPLQKFSSISSCYPHLVGWLSPCAD